MPIVIFNSLTKKKEEFIPAVPGEVRMYTCGVTVYDDCHVGHARSLFVFDVMKRYMEYRGYKVRLVRNITDVDDKIIDRARQEKKTFEEIRKRYIDNYYRDLKSLEIEKADFEPLATENVFYMVDHIKQLIAKGHAYEAGGDVYFSVRSFSPYGRLSGQSLDDMLTAVRIEKDEKKRDPLDFALWKKSKEGEPSWDSPWGPGRPGWHIECSTMSMRYLRAQTLDIHAGGRDLIFPHHENEIAQAEALTGQTFARYWIHHGLLTIDGKKMSKSLGNFVTIQDALKRYKPDVLKLFFLSAHCASPMDFNFDSLEETKRRYQKLRVFLDTVAASTETTPATHPLDAAQKRQIDFKEQEFQEAMDDDFNTAQGLAVFSGLLNLGNEFLSHSDVASANYVSGILQKLTGILGLKLAPSPPGERNMEVTVTEILKARDSVVLPEKRLSKEEIEKLRRERLEARKKKDFKRADEIRDYLRQHGILIEDKEKIS